MLVAAMGKRSDQGRGGLVRKTGTYLAGGEVRTYRYWQASREIPRELLAPGDGRRRVTGSGSSKAEAWRRCNANYDALLQGRARTGRRIRSAPMSVQELFDQWQAVNESGAVSAVMARKYRGYFENHILPHMGDVRVDRLSEADLTVLFHRTLADKVHAETGKPLLSEASRRNIYMAMSGALQFAVRAGAIRENPLTRVAPPRKQEPQDDIDGALASLDALMAVIMAPGNPDEARHLLAFLGLRRSERLGLRWSDISGLDSDSPVLHVRGQLARDPATGRLVLSPRTKSGRGRSIALAEPFTGALRRLRDRQRRARAEGLWDEPAPEYADMLFLQANGYPTDQNDDNDDWRALLHKAGVPYFRGHLARHLTAVLLARQPDVSIATVMSILGHGTQAMSIYYAHVDRGVQSATMHAFGQTLSGNREVGESSIKVSTVHLPVSGSVK